MSAFLPDLVIKNAEGSLGAVIEVKNLQNLSRDEAIALRHDLVDYGLPSQIPYFLLLSQDIGFLWKGQNNLDAPPLYEFPMDPVIKRYLKKNPERRLYGTELELLVLQWLLNLTTKPQQDVEEPEKTLARSGFNDSIKGGAVLLKEAV